MRHRTKSPAEETWDDIWQRRATTRSIVSMRKVFQEGDIPPGTPVSRLGDHELGWLHVAELVHLDLRPRRAGSRQWLGL